MEPARLIGGLPPPPGVTPNLVDSYNTSGYIIAVLVVCLTFSTLLVWIRLYTRFYITKSHEWDDYTSFAAWLELVAYIGMSFLILNYGGGIHQWDVPLKRVVIFLKIVYANEILYSPLLFTTKLSVLLTYLRIFGSTRKDNTYYAIHLLIWINLLYYIAEPITMVFTCIPPRKFWEPFIPGHCLNTLKRATVTSVINVVSDFSILLLPISKIWQLQIRVKKKIGLSAVFGIGLCACVSSVMRLFETIKNVESRDVTYDIIPPGLWTVAECTCGILCGCLPVVPRFFRHFNIRLPSQFRLISRAWKRGSPINSPPGASIIGKRTVPRHDPCISQKIKGTYLELDKRPDCHLLPTNTGSGGACSYSAEASVADDPNIIDYEDLEHGVPESGIRKIIRIETSGF